MTKDKIIAQQATEISALKSELSVLKKLIFGQKSERFVGAEESSDQIGLFAESPSPMGEPQATDIATYKRKKSKPHPGRHAIPSHIPVEIKVIEPEQDTTGMKCIGKDVTQTLNYTPAKLICIQYERPKYVEIDGTSDSDNIIIADLPSRPIDKGIAGAGLLAHFWVSKFVDHLPFYRQIEMFKRDHKMIIPSSTMNDWFIKCSQLLEPLYNTLKQKILDSDYLQVDESPIRVLESPNKGKSHKGYMWVYHSVGDADILFDYSKGRGNNAPKAILKNHCGYLQCDGYKVYDQIGRSDKITLVGCLAHARRYFHEARNTDKVRAEHALSIIKRVYQIDRQIKEGTIQGRRSELLDPLLLGLKTWVDQQANSVLPKSAIGKAMTYFIRQWPKLKNITIEDRVLLDNNLIENKIRPLALGRKNYLFAGNHGSAQRIAMMYSFFASCKANDLNPTEWMADVLQRISDTSIKELNQLLPSNYLYPNS